MPNKCETCVHWDWESLASDGASKSEHIRSNVFGYCRRNAPSPIVAHNEAGVPPSGRTDTNWPETSFNDWCGEHQEDFSDLMNSDGMDDFPVDDSVNEDVLTFDDDEEIGEIDKDDQI